jgi:hypothetical protein
MRGAVQLHLEGLRAACPFPSRRLAQDYVEVEYISPPNRVPVTECWSATDSASPDNDFQAFPEDGCRRLRTSTIATARSVW